jgi:hypothetical protein
MAILQSSVFRVRPGKAQEFMADVATAKRILERLGARVRVVNQVVGTNAPCTAFITESEDWKAYGEFSAKIETDSEWQKFYSKAALDNPNPAADLIATGLSTDAPVG